MTLLRTLSRVFTPTVGVGILTLGAAVQGYDDFSLFPDQTFVVYDLISIEENGTVHRERGHGTYSTSGTTLTRNVETSNNGNALISIPAGANTEVLCLHAVTPAFLSTGFSIPYSNVGGVIPAALTDGEFAINQHDGHVFWRDDTGAVRTSDLTAIASIPGLLALHSVVGVDLFGTVGSFPSVALDPRTTHVIVLVYGGSGGSATVTPGTAAGSGGASAANSVLANGGAGTGFDISGNPTPGADGTGGGGLVIIGGGSSGALAANGVYGGRGGLTIGYMAASGTIGIVVGAPGSAGSGGAAGNSGGVVVIELT